MRKTYKILLHIILISIIVGILLYLTNQYFVPFGRLKVTCQNGHCSKLITNFASKENGGQIMNDKEGNEHHQISKEPLYFDVNLPRNFHAVELQAVLSIPVDFQVIKWGLQRADGQYDTKVLYSGLGQIDNKENPNIANGMIIDLQLSKNWEYIEPYIKNKRIKMFLNFPDLTPDNERILIKTLKLTFIKPKFNIHNLRSKLLNILK